MHRIQGCCLRFYLQWARHPLSCHTQQWIIWPKTSTGSRMRDFDLYSNSLLSDYKIWFALKHLLFYFRNVKKLVSKRKIENKCQELEKLKAMRLSRVMMEDHVRDGGVWNQDQNESTRLCDEEGKHSVFSSHLMILSWVPPR